MALRLPALLLIQMVPARPPVWRSLNCESPLDFRFQLTQLSYTHHCSKKFTSWRCGFLPCIIRPLVGNAHPTNSDNYYRISLCYKAKKQLVLVPRSSLLVPSICMARPAGFEPATLGLAYQLRLSAPHCIWVCGLDYLFTISGVARIVSTEPAENQQLT